jgi:hypothetical protein
MIKPSDCNVFIQIWVDTDALQNGSTNGVYLVDNYLNHGSTNEGTPNLHSNVTTNSKICWTILNVNTNSDTQLSLQNFGNAGIWGASGTPQQYSATQWTAQAQVNGNDYYNITFNAQSGGGSGITSSVNPSMNVHS